MLNLTIEKFDSSEDHYYLLLNGRVIAAVLPQDIETIVNSIPSDAGSRKFVHQTIDEYYSEVLASR